MVMRVLPDVLTCRHTALHDMLQRFIELRPRTHS